MKRTTLYLALVLVFGSSRSALACPFCSAESRTLTEEMGDSSVSLLAKLTAPSEASKRIAEGDVPYGFVDPETGAARFTVERVLLGEPLMKGVAQIEAVYFGEPDTERAYFIRGVGDPPDWAIPLPLSEIATEYVPKLIDLPESGADRLAFFQDYLEHEDPLLGQDAYDEFARAPYQDVLDLAPRMDRDQLRDWIEDYSVSPSRRRLFLTMLGVCGEPEDVARLQRMLTSDGQVLGPVTEAGIAVAMATGASPAFGMAGEMVRFGERQRKLGLDALIACYLTLAGKHGDASQALDLVDERFLEQADADYSHVYASLQALRFLAEEQRDLVPLKRLLKSARLLLDNPDFADQVIPDLARWEDWSVLDRLAEMYRSTFDRTDENAPVKYVREPIVTYLDVAAEQEDESLADRAKKALADIEPLDPAAVSRARSLRAFGFLAQARAKRDDAASETAPSLDSVDEAAEEDGSMAPALTDTSPPETPGEAATTEALPASTVSTATSTTAPTARPIAKADPAPPRQFLLIGAPLAAATLLVGLFWLILRGGVA